MSEEQLEAKIRLSHIHMSVKAAGTTPMDPWVSGSPPPK